MTYLIEKYSALMLLIFGGAVTHGMIQWRLARDGGTPYQVVDFLIAMVISGFAGAMFTFGGLWVGLEGPALNFVAGMGTFLGLTGVNYLAKIARTYLENKLGVSDDSKAE